MVPCILKDQLDSLASQSCKEFFIIARDDGSTDASYGMLQNFMQHTSLHVKVLEERTNCGAVRKFGGKRYFSAVLAHKLPFI